MSALLNWLAGHMVAFIVLGIFVWVFVTKKNMRGAMIIGFLGTIVLLSIFPAVGRVVINALDTFASGMSAVFRW